MKKDLNPLAALCFLIAFLFALVGHALGTVGTGTFVFLVVGILLIIGEL